MTIAVVPDEALLETLDEVAAAYGVAARLLLDVPDEELLARLAEPGLLDAWPACHCEESVRGLASLRRSLREAEPLAALLLDHRRLLAGASSLIPPPFESAYRPTEELRFAVAAVEPRDVRHVFGLRPATSWRGEGDHLGLELAAAGRLVLAAAEALARHDRADADRALAAHRAFLAEHLLRWAPGCLREIESAASTHFYRGAAELALSVLACAHERLGRTDSTGS
jgi:TorA maturation chaperone TorD